MDYIKQSGEGLNDKILSYFTPLYTIEGSTLIEHGQNFIALFRDAVEFYEGALKFEGFDSTRMENMLRAFLHSEIEFTKAKPECDVQYLLESLCYEKILRKNFGEFADDVIVEVEPIQTHPDIVEESYVHAPQYGVPTGHEIVVSELEI